MTHTTTIRPAAIPLILVMLLAVSGLARGETVELSVTPAVRASAEYAAGAPDKPAVLLVHGFLQTKESPVIYRLTDHLKSLGYTVLAPTISLGIDLRAKSLDCDAVHPHTLDDEIREIGLWIDWLTERTDAPVALVGHSSGALSSLVYLSRTPSPRVSRGVLVSLIHMGAEAAGRQQLSDVLKARARSENGETQQIDIYRLAYCDKYPAPADAYISYVQWESEAVMMALDQARRPLSIVFGTADRTAPEDWRARVTSSGAEIYLIDEGDHFFRDMAEFELADTLNAILASPPGGRRQ